MDHGDLAGLDPSILKELLKIAGEDQYDHESSSSKDLASHFRRVCDDPVSIGLTGRADIRAGPEPAAAAVPAPAATTAETKRKTRSALLSGLRSGKLEKAVVKMEDDVAAAAAAPMVVPVPAAGRSQTPIKERIQQWDEKVETGGQAQSIEAEAAGSNLIADLPAHQSQFDAQAGELQTSQDNGVLDSSTARDAIAAHDAVSASAQDLEAEVPVPKLVLTSATGIATTLDSASSVIVAGRGENGLPDRQDIHREHLLVGWHAFGWGARAIGTKNPVKLRTAGGEVLKLKGGKTGWTQLHDGDTLFFSEMKEDSSLRVAVEVLEPPPAAADHGPIDETTNDDTIRNDALTHASMSLYGATLYCAVASWSFQIQEPVTVIGRPSKKGASAPANADCTPPTNDRSMSRSHAEIRRSAKDGSFLLVVCNPKKDAKPNRGVVDGQTVCSDDAAGTPLRQVSSIFLGGTELRFVDQRACAVSLQARVRGWIGRREFLARLDEEDEKIQKDIQELSARPAKPVRGCLRCPMASESWSFHLESDSTVIGRPKNPKNGAAAAPLNPNECRYLPP